MNLHTLNLSDTGVADVSALGSCVNLHCLDLFCCYNVADVSALTSYVTIIGDDELL